MQPNNQIDSGYSPEPAPLYCTSCGSEINPQAIVCPACGAPTANYQQTQQTQQPPQYQQPTVNVYNTTTVQPGVAKDKWVAVLLCFFLGVLGVHKFYEGKTGMGVLYIFTVGLFGIGVLVDFITLLFKPNPYYV